MTNDRPAAMLAAAAAGAWLLAVAPSATAFADTAGREEAQTVAVLDGSSFWRVRESFADPLIQTADGLKPPPAKGGPFHYTTLWPEPGWAACDFDDSGWGRRHYFIKYANGELDHRAGGGAQSPHLRQLTLRGKFRVTDPAAVGRLTLRLGFRGGAIVYLNGREVARAHIPVPGKAEGPAGKVAPGAPAEMYPDPAYVRPDGKPYHWWTDRDTIGKECWPHRVRRLDGAVVPARLLRRGVNVLGIEIHAAPYHQAYVVPKRTKIEWATCGLVDVQLRAAGAKGLVPNVVRPPGVQAWNVNTAERLCDVEYGDPNETLRPLAMAVARNGFCSARVVISSDKPIRDPAARISDLVGPGGAKLPASAVQIGYGRFDVPPGSRWGGAVRDYKLIYRKMPVTREQGILLTPPKVVDVLDKALDEAARRADGLSGYVGGAFLPVWTMVEVPADATAGDYAGTLTVTLAGADPVIVPVRLEVIDWTLPDPADYTFFMGLIQAPEGVALPYDDVTLWSERHWEMIGRHFDYLAKLGNKVLYLQVGAESQYGNAESLLRWVRTADGTHAHDLGRLQRYVDLALKRMGRPKFVVVGVWDSCMHCYAPKDRKRNYPRFTEVDAATGKVRTADGPVHGTPEAAAFWKPVLHKIRDLLADRRLDDAMLLGYCADRRPGTEVLKVFHDILPGVGWQSTNHHPRGYGFMPVGDAKIPKLYLANVWGCGSVPDPAKLRLYGWKHLDRQDDKRTVRVWLDRDLYDASPIVQFRLAPEGAILSGRRGLGQIGIDFWDRRDKHGRVTGSMVGRFPGTSEGNLGAYLGHLLYPGPRGGVPSVAYVLMRENIQECEARIFLEQVLLDGKLPADLAGECRKLLDERTHWHRNWAYSYSQRDVFPYSGWEARSAALYEAAGRAAAALRAAVGP